MKDWFVRQKLIRYAAILAAMVGVSLGVSACGQSNADVAAHNLSVAAEQFEIPRHIVGINGITDKYLFEVEGYCSVETQNSGLAGALEVTCKVQKPGEQPKYKKIFLGLSDNVTYVVDQLQPAAVSTSRYRVIFKPETLIPNIDLAK